MTWTRPRPNTGLMRLLGVLNRAVLLHGLPLLRRIPGLRDLPFVRGYFRVRAMEIPADDFRRLEAAVNPGTVAFLGPNHPEFGADWLVDKEISTWVAPRMAAWADRGIIAAAPRFFGMNNLVANDGGEAAREYSVEQALAGHGVLLHPEGTVRWTNDVVHPLFGGIAQMALAAAARTDRPVFIVPLVWKYQFVGDVSAQLDAEMRHVERSLGLRVGRGLDIPLRFTALQCGILKRQMERFEYIDRAPDDDFFRRQSVFQAFLIHSLEQRYDVERSDDTDKYIARLARAVRAELTASRGDTTAGAANRRALLERDVAMTEEAKRLGEFARATYGTPMLTQEQVSESLKRIRDRLLRRGWKNTLANMLPRPLGPRVVHVAVPEVIAIPSSGDAPRESELLATARARMQAALDDINVRIAPDVQRFAHRNPFAMD
ncbi:MAG: hypothetical protein ABJA80_08710 [bacterium]